MSDQRTPPGHDHSDSDTIDSIARAAGAALRRPAPADGVARLQSSHRRRQAVKAAAAGTTVAVLAVALVVFVGRGSDDDRVVVTPPSSAPAPPTSADDAPDLTTIPSVTDPTVDPTVAPSTVPTTDSVPSTDTEPTSGSTIDTEAPQASTWTDAVDPFPSLTYIACCGLDWEEGDPSPAVPADPAVPLAAGIYNVATPSDDGSDDPLDDDFLDGVLTLEIRPYVACPDLPEFRCRETAAPTDLGVAVEPARVLDVPLDDTVRIAISGFGCDTSPNPELLRTVRQFGTGSDLRTLFEELEAAYDTAVGAPLSAGVAPEQVAIDLAADPTAGFFDPGCPTSTNFAWNPSVGPTIMTPLQLTTYEGIPVPAALTSPARSFIHPTGLSVDESGVLTVYLYAGFQS